MFSSLVYEVMTLGKLYILDHYLLVKEYFISQVGPLGVVFWSFVVVVDCMVWSRKT